MAGQFDVTFKNNGVTTQDISILKSGDSSSVGNTYRLEMPFQANYNANYFIEIKGTFGTKRIELDAVISRQGLVGKLNDLGIGIWSLDTELSVNRYFLFTDATAFSFEYEENQEVILAWANANISAYKSINNHIPSVEFVYIENYLYSIFTTNNYYFNNFQSNVSGDWFFYVKSQSETLNPGFFLKDGDVLNLDINGNLYQQNDFPFDISETGFDIICSTTDGWDGINTVFLPSMGFEGYAPAWTLVNCIDFSIGGNKFEGSLICNLSTNVEDINFSSNDFTSTTLIALTKTDNYDAQQNNFTDIDAFLATQEAYTLGFTPTVDLLMNLGGTGMPIPSAAGLTSRTNIINAYIAAGRTATIIVNS